MRGRLSRSAPRFFKNSGDAILIRRDNGNNERPYRKLHELGELRRKYFSCPAVLGIRVIRGIRVEDVAYDSP